MHTATIVAQVMQCCLPLMHAARWRALHDVVVSSVNGCALSLVALAVGTPRTTTVRHRVKCVDRLLGNRYLESHRFDLYAALARQWLTGLPQILIVVDWSSLTTDMQWHWLRASVVCDGRSITLYEEVHPRKHLVRVLFPYVCFLWATNDGRSDPDASPLGWARRNTDNFLSSSPEAEEDKLSHLSERTLYRKIKRYGLESAVQEATDQCTQTWQSNA